MEIKLTDEQLKELLNDNKFTEKLAKQIADYLINSRYLNDTFPCYVQNIRIELLKILNNENILKEIKHTITNDIKQSVRYNLSTLIRSLLE